METIVFANVFVFAIVGGIVTAIGLDLKKRSSWLWGIYGFLTGLSLSLLRSDISGGLQAGLIFASMVMFGGAVSRWHKQRYNIK